MAFSPSSLDRLSMYGIMPMDCTEMVYGTPSPYLSGGYYTNMPMPAYPQMQAPNLSPKELNPPKDYFGTLHSDEPIEKWKYYLAGTFLAYLVGALATRSLNPIKIGARSAQGIFKGAQYLCTSACNGIKSLGNKIKGQPQGNIPVKSTVS